MVVCVQRLIQGRASKKTPPPLPGSVFCISLSPTGNILSIQLHLDGRVPPEWSTTARRRANYALGHFLSLKVSLYRYCLAKKLKTKISQVPSVDKALEMICEKEEQKRVKQRREMREEEGEGRKKRTNLLKPNILRLFPKGLSRHVQAVFTDKPCFFLVTRDTALYIYICFRQSSSH